MVLATTAPGRPPRSDTVLLVHVPADRADVRAVSMPRDLLVPIPACRTEGGKTLPARVGMINSVYPAGGIRCAVKTVEALTDVRIDQTVVIDSAGFRSVVDAVGGVWVTLPRAVADQESGLRLPAGRTRLNGEQALAYVRARHGFGDGSDMSRVRRQRQFMAALAREASSRMAEDPVRFAKFLATLAGAVETVPRMGVAELRTLARGFLKRGSIEFHTVPARPAKRDPNRLEWDPAEAKQTFGAFRTP